VQIFVKFLWPFAYLHFNLMRMKMQMQMQMEMQQRDNLEINGRDRETAIKYAHNC